MLDERIVLQILRNARKGLGVGPMSDDGLEEKQRLEGREGGWVTHAPRRSASPAIEGPFARRKKMKWRHGLFISDCWLAFDVAAQTVRVD
jgi:hypothetical protein